jgi:hypothetical protein
VVICDNDIIHHARKITAYLEEHPRLELLYGARYSPHDNPVANTAVSWPGRLRQIHSFFRNRSPGQMLATAAPWTSPLAASGLRAGLLECRFSSSVSAGSSCGRRLLTCYPSSAEARGPPRQS